MSADRALIVCQQGVSVRSDSARGAATVVDIEADADDRDPAGGEAVRAAGPGLGTDQQAGGDQRESERGHQLRAGSGCEPGGALDTHHQTDRHRQQSQSGTERVRTENGLEILGVLNSRPNIAKLTTARAAINVPGVSA
jgi:hypothetical protein